MTSEAHALARIGHSDAHELGHSLEKSDIMHSTEASVSPDLGRMYAVQGELRRGLHGPDPVAPAPLLPSPFPIPQRPHG